MVAVMAAAVASQAASIIRNPAPADTSEWILFRKTINITGNPVANSLRIAADSKYWLRVNGEIEVREGALKRGPNPHDTYADRISLKNLHTGDNTIEVLVWYFGKQGFSHRSTQCPGLYFDLEVGGRHYSSDSTWLTAIEPHYYLPAGEIPNYRLTESNVGYDASVTALPHWQHAIEVDAAQSDWGQLHDRPIPMWRDWQIAPYVTLSRKPGKVTGQLPYNCQMTPWMQLRAHRGDTINICTDHYSVGGIPTVRAQYVCREGEQEFEMPGWINGHSVTYTFPAHVEMLQVGYRQTGYDCDLSGWFSCDDAERNASWRKAQRTLYVTMRDSYMDCPDRERGQWIGDVTNELVEQFYALSPSASLLTRKALRELADWQKPDSVIYAPIPSGKWDRELPMQSMAAVGLGAWNYFVGSADTATMHYIFPAVKRYVHKWRMLPSGLVQYRKGAWDWGDWGPEQDMQAMCQLWYLITLQAYAKQATLEGDAAEASWAESTAKLMKRACHKVLWNGKCYRWPNYKGRTDDRVQGLAVIAGVARPREYAILLDSLMAIRNCSPYMERYVEEAMCLMGKTDSAVSRMAERYHAMAVSPKSTLWELFNPTVIGGQSSYNHAWSGAPLLTLSRWVAGISPLMPGFREFEVSPHMGKLKRLTTQVPTAFGSIKLSINVDNGHSHMSLDVPEGTVAHVLPGTAASRDCTAGHWELDW